MMQVRLWTLAAAAGSVMALAGCAMGPNQQLGAGGGALAGAVVGNAISDNKAGTLGGAAIGGLIGNEIGRRTDERNATQPYYPPASGYYPNNGPRY